MIDLHCHSYFSDGMLSPNALLKKAIDSNIRILALTDHDTTEGLSLLHEAAQEHDIKVINGIELSVRWKKYDVHILGLNIQPDNQHLQELIARQNENRIARARQIGEQLLNCGIDEAYKKASKIAGHERVGRAHFAQLLVTEGRVPDMKAAFKRYLGSGRPAYVATAWLTMSEAVAGIIQAGGQAVIAHPLKYGLTRSKLHELINIFKEEGGIGMEVVSGAMTKAQMMELAGLSQRYDLLASTGSDYHGDMSHIGLGRQQPLPVNCKPIWHQWV